MSGFLLLSTVIEQIDELRTMIRNKDDEKELYRKAEKQHVKNIKKWGHQHPELLMAVLTEEVGEVAKAYLQSYYGHGPATSDDLRDEIVQAVAVLVELYREMEGYDYVR